MHYNKLGKSNIQISPLTLGCMSLGKDASIANLIINTAIDSGINHLDTADLYDFGENEEIVGKAIQSKRTDIVLSTKVGNRFDRITGTYIWDPSKKHIIEGCKNSLQRLGTDYIDLYMLHGGKIEDPIDESIDAFETLKKEGYIRAYGISSIRPNVIRTYVEQSSIDAVMMQYSLLDRRPEEEILDFLLENDISVLARGPLAKGLLSEEINSRIKEKQKSGYLNYNYTELYELFSVFKQLQRNQNLQQLAFKYVLHHPAVVSAVFGASSLEQLKKNLQIDFSQPLKNTLYRELQSITKDMFYENHR